MLWRLSVCSVLLLLSGWHVKVVQSARILGVVPGASYSHQNFFHQIWRALSLRGHEVVVITTHPQNDPRLTNLTEMDMHFAVPHWAQVVRESVELEREYGHGAMFARILEGAHENIEMQLSDARIQELIADRNQHFDLVMIEYFDAATLGFKARFNCPFIGILPVDAFPHQHAIMGNAVHELLYPSVGTAMLDSNSIMTRCRILFRKMFDFYISYKIRKLVNGQLKRFFGDDTLDVREIAASIDMLFINTHPLLGPVRPLTPSTITIGGGIHLKAPKPLPQMLQEYLDSATEGVIYFSLGSNVQSKDIAPETIAELLRVFATLPYKILWKFETDNLPNKPDNVAMMKWCPQQDVLRHPNVKAYIMQGGLQSFEEAIFAHVPLIVMPFYMDQQYFANLIERRGYGFQIDVEHFDAERFRSCLLEIINNDKYRKAMRRLSELISDEPMRPLDKALWWIEYVLRHGGAQHLKGATLPFYKYYYLDALGLILSVAYLVYKIVHELAKRVIVRHVRKEKSA